jgi:ribA/ribD-fused uncharacterized protein
MNEILFFYGGPCSQWYRSPMMIDGVKYNCAEQYMMAQKALLFGDEDVYFAIMRATDPSEQKMLGRQVRNFDADKWNEVAKEVVYKANLAKFTQNEDLKQWLEKTGDRELVEASPTDCIWGIGLSTTDPRRHDRSQWRGTNWLGEAIMRARKEIFNS